METISKYNIVNKNIHYSLIYNSLSGAFVKIHNNQIAEIESNENIRNKLIANGILAEHDKEFNKFKYLCYRSSFSGNCVVLYIAPSMNCNFSCFYCFEEGNKKVSKSIMKEEVENAIVSYLEKNKNKKISIIWFGGEPMIGFKNILSISQKLIDKEIKFTSSMITNGSLFNKKRINELKNINLLRIQISMDGTFETHNKRRYFKNGKGSFEVISNNIHNILQHTDIPIYIQTAIDKTNISAFDDISHLFRDQFAEHINKKLFINYNLVQNRTNFDNEGICFNPNDQFEFIKSRICLNSKGKYNSKLDLALPCMYRSENQFAIDPEGNIYKCIENLGNNHLSVGNILEKNISLTRLSEAAFEEDPFLDEECSNCNVFPICGGGCPLDRIRNKKEKKKTYCSFYKTKLVDLLPILYNKTNENAL